METEDWRLLGDVEFLKGKNIEPVCGDDLGQYRPNLKRCVFCLDEVKPRERQRWYVPEDKSCCICEKCFNDFREHFSWRLLDGWDVEW